MSIPFQIQKEKFYSSKDMSVNLDFNNISLRRQSTKYTPCIKKIVEISSESESESDEENMTKNINIFNTPKRSRKHINASDENCLSPSKQMKTNSPKTPCNLFNQLSLISPIVKQDKLVPKKLFNNGRYSDARKALHSSLTQKLIGREYELSILEDFLQSHLDKELSGSIYVSGLPGTGKTASLSNIILKAKFKNTFKIIYINCTTIKCATTIYSKIIQELNLMDGRPIKNKKDIIEKYLVQSKKMLLLILDEIDNLETKNQSVLYSIFEWPSIPQSKFVFVGIANALDLIDRILPRLQARCGFKPTLLHFKPYTKEQIMDIIIQRLKEANALNIFSDSAIKLLAGKVAAVSGDIRRALDIGRRVVEVAESQKLLQVVQPAKESDEIKKNKIISMASEEKLVDFKEILRVINGVYGGSQNVDNEENSFPMQQKILLCSLMLILNNGTNKDVNIGRLYQVYRNICNSRKIVAVDMSEFVCLCTLVETRGILRVIMKKETRLSKIRLQWDQEVLTEALQDKDLTSDIINDISCL